MKLNKVALLYEQFNPLISIYTKFLEEYGFKVYSTKDIDDAFNFLSKNRVELLWAKYEAVENHSAPSGVELFQKAKENIENYDEICKIISITDIYKNKQINLIELGIFSILRVPATKEDFNYKLSNCVH